MSFNVAGATQIGIDLFGGLVTEEPPENLPQGASPDNQDVVFRPGAVGARPALKKVFATPFGATTVTYGKSFMQPDGTVVNLYLDALGNLWEESTFGSPTIIGTVTPGSYARSATAFGREYIAISDGLHGTDVPLQFDGTNLDRVTQDGPGIAPEVANVILAPSTLTALVRASNLITATTSSAHNLKPGYRVQISGLDSEPIDFITEILIDNENSPGIATVTTVGVHGLSPGMFVIIEFVDPTVVGTAAACTGSRQGQIVTIDTVVPHGLQPGAEVKLTGFTGGSPAGINTTFNNISVIVQTVPSASTFTFIQADIQGTAQGDTTANVTGGTVSILWPVISTDPTTLWEVVAIPSDTTFQVQINYSSGKWTGTGTSGAACRHPLDGTFFVNSVPTSTTFTYQQQGPDNSLGVATGALATPQGQVAPGQHLMQVAFLTRQGYITTPSPPVKFIANGDQYLQVTDIPVGPPNVVARIIAFTGVDGANFFYIPVPAQINGQLVSTATQINDNSTTSVLLDFSDVTLFSSLGINIPGNNLPAQIVLDGALGFGLFASRLITWGQRNTVNNLLNLGFDGGSCTRQAVTGWTGTGTLVAGHFSQGVSGPSLHQSFAQDYLGKSIAAGNTQYTARCWATGSVTITISSASTGFSTSAVITPGVGGWGQADFGSKTPNTIPTDLVLTVTSGAVVDNLSIIFTEEPFTNDQLMGSYVDNPEGFDGVSGIFGSDDDTHAVMGCGIIRGTLYFLTQDPGGRIHAVSGTGLSEPVGWTANEVASNCGALSTFGITQSQADSATAAGGEEWMSWASASGARIFSGDQPWNISLELLPNWQAINPAAFLTVWAMNDPVGRKIYFGLPIATTGVQTPTAPTLIFPVDYKNLDTAYEIAQSPPIHVTFTGKMAARDHARKWTRWNLTMNGAALIYRASTGAQLYPVFFAGNGAFPNSVAGGFGNIYTLGCNGYIDDDFGQFFPYYVTYFFTSVELEQAMQLGGQRHLLQYLQWEILGTGFLYLTVLVNQLDNPWPRSARIQMRTDPTYDDEWGGGQASGQRFALKFAPAPT